MKEKDDMQYGIKYRVIKLVDDQYILFPVSLEKGIEMDDFFRTEKRMIPYAFNKEELDNTYVMDMIMSIDEIKYAYDYDGEEEFLLEYFYDDFKNTLIYVDTNPEDGCYMARYEINLDLITKENRLTYIMENSIPSIILNEKALNEILASDNIDEVKVIINKYKKLIKKFNDYNKSKGITKISVLNGEVESVEVNRKVSSATEPKGVDFSSIPVVSTKEISTASASYQGLRKHIKERVFGHDEAIDTFAQKLYMNYTAEDGEPVESILFVGPTGTGKTETVKAACEYLDIPSFSVNASNIIPQGIKGMSIEDVIVGLYEQAGHDEEKAERGLVFLDEFDKLNETDMELKSAVKNILLTFTAGGTFPIDNDRYSFMFDSSMTNKVYAGVFDKIYHQRRKIGFETGTSTKNPMATEEAIRNKIIKNGYFSLEELSRISTILGFEELDRETKKRIILSSKLSEFAKKKKRYKRQFNIDLEADESYIEAILDSLSEEQNGMRSLNNYIKRTINHAERAILENEDINHKKLILTKSTVEDPTKFDLT